MARFQGVNRPNKGKKKRTVPTPIPSKGLGDTIEKIIHKATAGKMKSCGGCKKRRDALNRLIPYKGCADCEKKSPPPR